MCLCLQLYNSWSKGSLGLNVISTYEDPGVEINRIHDLSVKRPCICGGLSLRCKGKTHSVR